MSMEIEDMPIAEKYESLLNAFTINAVVTQAFLKETGLTDQFMDYNVKFSKRMMPTLSGTAFKILKRLSPGRIFTQVVESLIKSFLPLEPASNFEVVSLSDREAVITLRNSVQYGMMRDLIRKSGLDLEVKELVEYLIKYNNELFKDFGIGVSAKIEKGARALEKMVRSHRWGRREALRRY